MKNHYTSSDGFGMIEVLIGLTIITIMIAAMFSISNRSLQARALSVQNVQAALLVGEGAEALRLIRDSGWATTSALTIGTSYSLAWNGTMWAPTTTAALVDGVFDRRFRLSAVSRDVNHRIVTTGGTIDPDGKSVTLSVSWKPYYGATTTRSTTFYLFNILN